ncbi:MAG: type II toxin-antitoxin system RelE/ParE family toxin [Proteobacteria bacterium]|nr:type II toxin-antitoxin system RelE/ParE family toxin [Pseudomonadota bacterium]
MAKARLLHRAEADLIVIARYTTAQFATQQAHACRDGLLVTLDALAEHPLMGSDQDHIRANLRRHVGMSACLQVAHHLLPPCRGRRGGPAYFGAGAGPASPVIGCPEGMFSKAEHRDRIGAFEGAIMRFGSVR